VENKFHARSEQGEKNLAKVITQSLYKIIFMIHKNVHPEPEIWGESFTQNNGEAGSPRALLVNPPLFWYELIPRVWSLLALEKRVREI